MNFDLIYTILKEISALDSTQGQILEIEGQSRSQIMQHIQYLYNEGLINTRDASSKEGPVFYVRSLTLKGFQMLHTLGPNPEPEARNPIGFRY